MCAASENPSIAMAQFNWGGFRVMFAPRHLFMLFTFPRVASKGRRFFQGLSRYSGCKSLAEEICSWAYWGRRSQPLNCTCTGPHAVPTLCMLVAHQIVLMITRCHHPRVLGSVCEWKGGVEFDYDFLLRQSFPKGMHYHAKHDYEFFL